MHKEQATWQDTSNQSQLEDPRWGWGEPVHGMWYFSSPVLWHCWLGDWKGIQPVKSWMLVCWRWWFDWSFAHLIAPTVTTTYIILSSNKIQNGDILVLANLGGPGKWQMNECRRRHDNSLCVCFSFVAVHWNNRTMSTQCTCSLHSMANPGYVLYRTVVNCFCCLVNEITVCLHCRMLLWSLFPQCFDTVGWVTGRASGL